MESFSPYHCSAEWHLARLRGKGAYYAPLVLSMALHLSKKKRRVFRIRT
jgi:hypothetical protein